MKLGMQMIANINNVTQFVGTVTWGVARRPRFAREC